MAPVTAGPIPQGRATFGEVLAQREFCAVVLAWLISMLGSVVAHVALAVLVYARTGSALLSALTLAIGWVPHLVLGTLLSGLVDRFRPRRLLVSCDLLAAVTVAAMALPGLPVWALLALVVVEGSITPVFQGTRSATLPELLPGDTYVLGRTLLSLVAQGSQLVGYAVGGVLVAVVSPQTALLADAASFLVSAVVLRLGMRDRPPPHTADGGRLAHDSLAALRVLWRAPRLRAMLLLGWIPPLFGVVPEAVAVPYAARAGAGSAGAGVIYASVATGVIAGELLTARLLPPSARLAVVPWLALWLFGPLLWVWLAPPVPALAALLVLSGLGWGFGTGLAQAWLAALPTDLRGRGLVLSGSGAMLTQAAGFAAGGAAADVVAPATAITGAGVAGLLATALVLMSLRRAGGLSGPGGPAAPGPAA